MLRDTDLEPKDLSELQAEEQDRELARRIRREVRRIQSGEADQEMKQELEQELAERRQQEIKEEEERRRQASNLRGLITGNILRREWLTEHYRYPLIIAAVFLLSIIVMFWSLSLDMSYTRKEREVQLLRERALRLKEQRNRLTSHSAVVEELRVRGIDLRDPVEAPEIVE